MGPEPVTDALLYEHRGRKSPAAKPAMTSLTVDGVVYEVISSRTVENDPTVAQVFSTKRPRGRRTYNVWLLKDGSYKVSKV